MQAETGKVRGEAGGEAVYLTDLINFYGKKAKKFIGDEKVRRPLAAAAPRRSCGSSTGPTRSSA